MASLMDYLPQYYNSVKEITAITNAENPEIEALDVALLQVRNNQFVLTADDKRIRQWERLLEVRPDLSNQSLDYRKAVVLMRLSTRLPLNENWLHDKLVEIVGAGHFVITMDNENYWLHIRLSNDVLGLTNELRAYLRDKVPANLGLTLEEIFKTWGEVLEDNYKTWSNVLATNEWLRVRLKTWGEHSISSCAVLMGLHTWQDVKNYEWKPDEVSGAQSAFLPQAKI